MLPARGPAQVRVSWLGCNSVGKDLGFVVDSELNSNQQCTPYLVAVKADQPHPGLHLGEKDKDIEYSSLLC